MTGSEPSPVQIILTATAEDLAPAWVDQLASGGRLVLPLSLRGQQRSVAFERAGDHLLSVSMVNCGFMPLRGALARADAVRRLGDEPGVLLELGDGRAVDTAALYAALGQPREAVATGVSMTLADVVDGLGLWLALHEPDVGRLTAIGAAVERGLVPALISFPGMVATTVLVGERALAALVRPDPATDVDRFDLRVQTFGPEADDLALRLAAHVHAWEAGGRPSTTGLRIRAYPQPADGDNDQTSIRIDTHHARLLLDW